MDRVRVLHPTSGRSSHSATKLPPREGPILICRKEKGRRSNAMVAKMEETALDMIVAAETIPVWLWPINFFYKKKGLLA